MNIIAKSEVIAESIWLVNTGNEIGFYSINDGEQVEIPQNVPIQIFLPPIAPWQILATSNVYCAMEKLGLPISYEKTINQAISNADLRRGLIEFGINPALVTAYLNSLPESAEKWIAITDWEYSNYVERVHPMLDQLAPNFGLTSEDVNQIFRSKPEYKIV